MNINTSDKINRFNELSKSESGDASDIRRECKTQCFNLVVFDLFSRCLPVSGEKKFVVEGHVLADGLGDYGIMNCIRNALHEKFPARRICSYIIGAAKHKGKLPSKNKAWHEEHIAFSTKNIEIGPPTISETPFQENLCETLNKIKNADLWISGPISNLGLFDSLSWEANKNKLMISEYDAHTNVSNIAIRESLQFGLKLTSGGIFIKSNKNNYTYQSIENKFIKNLLFDAPDPSSESIEKYLSTHVQFFCYFSEPAKVFNFVKRAIVFAETHHPGKTIDLIYLCKEIVSPSDLSGRGSTKFISLKNDSVHQAEIKLGDKGVDLRLINPGQITSKDFKILTFLSSPLVGCRGNISAGLALSFGKIPFFERNSQTRSFNYNFAKLAELHLGTHSPYVQFLYASNDGDEANEFLKNPTIIREAYEFGILLKEHYDVTPIIQGMANRILCHNKNLEFALKEDEIRKNFFKGKMDLHEVQNQITAELQNLKLFPVE